MNNLFIKARIPNSHYVIPFGIYPIIRVVKGGWWISTPTSVNLYVKRGEGFPVEGDRMKLSELAKCMKFLEILKWKLIDPEFCSRRKVNKGQTPFETFYLSQFPYGSAFCYVFREHKVTSKIEGKWECCFCPKMPFKHAEKWGKVDYSGRPNIELTEGPHVSCVLDLDGVHRSTPEIIKELESIKIHTIMQFLKRIQIPHPKLQVLSHMWHFYVMSEITIPRIGRVTGQTHHDYIKGYQE
jgi:hypothetical protein